MEELNLASLLSVVGAALVVGIIVQIVKGWIAERFIPLSSVLIGMGIVVLASIILSHTGAEELGNAALTGLLAGASASGIYDLSQRTVRGK